MSTDAQHAPHPKPPTSPAVPEPPAPATPASRQQQPTPNSGQQPEPGPLPAPPAPAGASTGAPVGAPPQPRPAADAPSASGVADASTASGGARTQPGSPHATAPTQVPQQSAPSGAAPAPGGAPAQPGPPQATAPARAPQPSGSPVVSGAASAPSAGIGGAPAQPGPSQSAPPAQAPQPGAPSVGTGAPTHPTPPQPPAATPASALQREPSAPPQPSAPPRSPVGGSPVAGAPRPLAAAAHTGGFAIPAAPAVETTTRLRPVRDTGPVPIPPAPPVAYRYYSAPPETPNETTTRLRPIRERRVGRVVAAGACLVLGLGLVGGALAGVLLARQGGVGDQQPPGYAEARTAWHSTPVDTLFPRTVKGTRLGPGGADRVWNRLTVAPDAPCSAAVLSPALVATLQPTGCVRVVRATYTDATATDVITVGLVFTDADAAAMSTLTGQLVAEGRDERADHMPHALPAPGTPAARFGDPQRASWHLATVPELPVLVYAVSGFADGRPVATPQPAAQAMSHTQTTVPAQAGLGHEAKGVADRIERGLRMTVSAATKDRA